MATSYNYNQPNRNQNQGQPSMAQPPQQPANPFQSAQDQFYQGVQSGQYQPNWGSTALTNVGISQAGYQDWQNQQTQQSRQDRVQGQTAPPNNPAEALDMQFYGAQQARDQQNEMIERMFGYTEQAQQQASQAHQENQARNEALMREGLAAQQQEAAAAHAQNMEMMKQRQATLQWMFGLLRQGGQGSLASFMSPLGSELGSTYQMGMQTPQQYGQFYQAMQGTPDPSSQYLGQAASLASGVQYAPPDYSAWMDPESMRSSWYLPPQTTVQQSIPTGPGGGQPGSFYNAPQPMTQQPAPAAAPYSGTDFMRDFMAGYMESQNY